MGKWGPSFIDPTKIRMSMGMNLAQVQAWVQV